MANNMPTQPPIDLNQADVETLITLPGIGPALAARIVRFREEVHPFEEAVEITAVPGISEKMYRQLAGSVTVSIPAAEAEPEAPPRAEPPAASEPAQVSPEAVEVTAEPPVRTSQPPAAPAVTSALVPMDKPPVGAAENFSPENPSPAPVPPAGFSRAGFWWRSCLLTVIGMLGGALLALLVIQRLNTTLDMATHPQVLQLTDQVTALERREATLNDEIRELRSRLNQMEALSGRVENAEADLQSLNQALTGLDEQITTLEQDNSQIKESVDQIRTAADRFDHFLEGLRALLVTEEGQTPANTSPTPSITSTPVPTQSIEAATPIFSSPTASSTATPTPRPSPTPTPTPTITATPLSALPPRFPASG